MLPLLPIDSFNSSIISIKVLFLWAMLEPKLRIESDTDGRLVRRLVVEDKFDILLASEESVESLRGEVKEEEGIV